MAGENPALRSVHLFVAGFLYISYYFPSNQEELFILNALRKPGLGFPEFDFLVQGFQFNFQAAFHVLGLFVQLFHFRIKKFPVPHGVVLKDFRFHPLGHLVQPVFDRRIFFGCFGGRSLRR